MKPGLLKMMVACEDVRNVPGPADEDGEAVDERPRLVGMTFINLKASPPIIVIRWNHFQAGRRPRATRAFDRQRSKRRTRGHTKNSVSTHSVVTSGLRSAKNCRLNATASGCRVSSRFVNAKKAQVSTKTLSAAMLTQAPPALHKCNGRADQRDRANRWAQRCQRGTAAGRRLPPRLAPVLACHLEAVGLNRGLRYPL